MTNLSKFNPSPEEFDIFYKKIDPWEIRGTIPELARIKNINSKFINCKFKNGLDIGCGEGHFTAKLKFIKNITAIDISEVALSRARKLYPEINFKKENINNLSSIDNFKYDFISCLECIYYISDESERRKTLKKIKDKGTENCLFCFSVVTIGENKYRKFQTYDEAIDFFKNEFNIVDQFPMHLGTKDKNILKRFFRKFKRLKTKLIDRYFDVSAEVRNYLEDLKAADPRSAYSTCFILIKK